jgi:3-hydroxyacyl-CoA dehydrogenase
VKNSRSETVRKRRMRKKVKPEEVKSMLKVMVGSMVAITLMDHIVKSLNERLELKKQYNIFSVRM